ncbi:MAG: type II toxin-antitoxin system Phd/YefM family antitoxin [Deltaproteobacteria bacterium]|nr:type II toxin-antitoxin system Phd/YefM family antitoxin [Deltaproteobacteria bacterium]
MEKVGISAFRENLSNFLKKAQKGQVISITSHGHEMAKLVPPEDKMMKARTILRELAKRASIGDVLSPIDDEWDAMK